MPSSSPRERFTLSASMLATTTTILLCSMTALARPASSHSQPHPTSGLAPFSSALAASGQEMDMSLFWPSSAAVENSDQRRGSWHIERRASDDHDDADDAAANGLQTALDVLHNGGDPTSIEFDLTSWLRESHRRLAGWMAIWGEGRMDVVIDPTTNLTVSHRPAAFPSHVPASHALPLSGNLTLIENFPVTGGGDGGNDGQPQVKNDMYGCLPTGARAIQETSAALKSHHSGLIALVVRGGCSFSHKVRSAQERGASAVVVADGPVWRGEGHEREDHRGDENENEDEDEARRRDALLTMYSPDDTSDIYIPSTFISRASYLTIRDLMQNHTHSGGDHLEVEIHPDDSWEWPLADMLLVVMLLPSILTLLTILLGRLRSSRQRKLDRAPSSFVLSLPERIWEPGAFEKSDCDSESVRSELQVDSADNNNEEDHTNGADDNDTGAVAPPSTTETPGNPDFNPEAIVRSPRPPHVHSHPHLHYFSPDECSICLQNFAKGDPVRILPCGHLFHKNEVDDWLIKWKKVCPVCRMDVTAKPTRGALSAVSAATAVTPVGDEDTTTADNPPAGRRLGRLGWIRNAVWPFRRSRRDLERGQAESPTERTGLLARP